MLDHFERKKVEGKRSLVECFFCVVFRPLTVIDRSILVLFLQAQRPEQSVMQALESLSDSQVRNLPSFSYMKYHKVCLSEKKLY